MTYLLLAILSSALVSVIMRMSTDKVKANLGMLAMNYLMALCLSVITGGKLSFAPAPGLSAALWLGSINGALFLASFVLFQLNVKKNGVVMSSVFMKLGLLVPIVMSVCFFGEVPELLQVAGFAVALIAIVLINLEKDESAVQFKAGLPLLLVLSGFADGMAKVFEELGRAEMSAHFFLFTFLVALVLSLVLMLAKKQKPSKWELIFGLSIGVPNFMSARFLLMALENMPAVIVYPSYSVGAILLVTLTGVGIFREKLGRRQWLAMALILAALVMLNL